MANKLDSERKRRALKPNPHPYRHQIKPKHYLTYRRNKVFNTGRWIALLGRKSQSLGLECDLDYAGALDAALTWFSTFNAETGEINNNACVDDAVRDYAAYLKAEKGPSTAGEVRARLNKHLSARLRSTRLRELTTPQVRRFRDSMVASSDDPDTVRRSKDSANRVLGMLKAALSRAYRDGLVSSDGAWKRVERFKGVAVARRLYLTPEQVSTLQETATGALEVLIRLGVMTGARYGELATARVCDFDAAAGTLDVNGKTGHRSVHLADTTAAFIQALVDGRGGDEYLTTQDSGNPWIKGSLKRSFPALIRRAELPGETVFYSLRHYHLSRALLAGVNAQVAAENCGTSIAMLEKHYAKFMQSDRRDMFNKVSL